MIWFFHHNPIFWCCVVGKDSVGNIKIENDINGNSENHEEGEIEEDSQFHHNHSNSTDMAVAVAPIQDGNRATDAIPDCMYLLKHGVCVYDSTC